MPRTKTVTLYQFAELNDKAKERAREWFRSHLDSNDFDTDEYVASMEAFAAHYGFKVTDWSLGGQGGYFKFVEHEIDHDGCLTGARLFRYLMNKCAGWKSVKVGEDWKKVPIDGQDFIQWGKDGGCPFTGYHTDSPPFDTFAEFMAKPDGRTLAELMHEAGETMRIACERQQDYCYSDEYADDAIIANEYEFDEHGNHA